MTRESGVIPNSTMRYEDARLRAGATLPLDPWHCAREQCMLAAMPARHPEKTETPKVEKAEPVREKSWSPSRDGFGGFAPDWSPTRDGFGGFGTNWSPRRDGFGGF